MTGIEIAIGYLFAWAVRKAQHVAGRADREVDRALDAGVPIPDIYLELL